MTEEKLFKLFMENSDLRLGCNANKDIIISPYKDFRTGTYSSKLIYLLSIWNDAHQAGEILDSTVNYRLASGSVYSPDVSYVSNERAATIQEEDYDEMFAHICPDFVIELKSKSDSLKQLKLKMDEYVENGCRLGFLINPEEEKTYIYKPGRGIIEKSFSEKVSGEDVLNGFELDCSFMISKK